MGRPRIRAGELGTIQITRLAAGSYRARVRARDDAGTLHQLVAVSTTEDAARIAVQRKAEALTTSMLAGLTGANTIAEAGAAWLEQVRARAIAGSLTFSTYESYETTVRCVVVPQCGGITLDALTVGRCDRIIQAILLQRSVSSARRARVVLGQGRSADTQCVTTPSGTTPSGTCSGCRWPRRRSRSSPLRRSQASAN
jgi:hypothetical protein